MKRDMELVRKILMYIDEHPHGYAPQEISIPSYTNEQIGYHCYLMEQARLIQARDRTSLGCESPNWSATSLTWEGHEFLDNSKDPKSWGQAKEAIEKLGGASFAVWTNVLTKIVMRNLGIDS